MWRRALWGDAALYAVSAAFAWVTVGSNLAAHGAWGAIAAIGYAAATAVVLVQLAVRRLAGVGVRAAVAVGAWLATALLPLLIEAVQRSRGWAGRAQEEVTVIEDGGRRLFEAGTPYLDRAAIAGLPEPLLGYMPYQPGMAAFGVPRALDPGANWWSDARLAFFVVTAAAVVAAMLALRRRGTPGPALVRALQAATVVPICALTLATGGDDLPVLALCLLALALAAAGPVASRAPLADAGAGALRGTRIDAGAVVSRGRFVGAGLAVGAAAALKLFAWPVAAILWAYAVTRQQGWRFAATAVGVPLATGLPVLLVDPGAMVENVLAFPFGHGLVSSPAASPLPGHLIATLVPGGRVIAQALVVAAVLAFAVLLVRRPPRSAGAAARLSGYALLTATLLLPSTRFGYLLYPLAFFVWAWAMDRIDRVQEIQMNVEPAVPSVRAE